MRRFPWGLTLLVIPAVAVLIALGVWQMQRLAWKNDLLARLEATRTAEAMPLATVLDEAARGSDIEHRRVILDCPGLAEARHVELTAIVEGQSGVRVISPCMTTAGGARILIDRGFVGDDDMTPLGAVPEGRTITEVTGVLRRGSEGNWLTPVAELREGPPLYYARQAAIADDLGLAGADAPWFVLAETSTNPDWPALRPIALPADVANNHLGYALTWFGLALGLVGVYVAMLRRNRLPQAAGPRGSGDREKEAS